MFYYLSLAAALFAIGLYGVFVRKNLTGMIISFFIMLNALIINFAAFTRFVKSDAPIGLVFIVFILVIFACQILCGGLIFYQWGAPTRNGIEENPQILK